MTKNRRKTVTKLALSVSVTLLAIWFLLGGTSTIAWFTDVDGTKMNNFILGDVEIELDHKVFKGNGNFAYESVEDNTKVFDDEALYEPGYTQVVFLKVKNVGTTAADYRFSVVQFDYTDAVSVTGDTIHLADHLLFGVVYGDTETDINKEISDRGGARAVATSPLADYTEKKYGLEVGAEQYLAIVIYMPEEVTDVANYRGNVKPQIELGITVTASQSGAIDKIPN